VRVVEVIAMLVIALRPAIADDDGVVIRPTNRGPVPLELQVNGGFELGVGPGRTSTVFRMAALAGGSFGSGSVRPQFAIGGVFSAGTLWHWSEDSRGRQTDYGTYGGELQLGLRFVDGGYIDSRLYLSAAAFRVRLAEGARDAWSSASPGYRFGIGTTFADRLGGVWRDRNQDRRTREHWYVLLLIPHHYEIAYERSAGSDRVGVMVGWGL